MRIDGLTLDLRERNAWEAFDLGIALARSTGLKLFVPYAIAFCALALGVHLITFLLDWPPLAALAILWWLKPAVDRVALSVLAQAVFGAAPSWSATLRGLRSIPRAGWLMSFTFGRLDFARSFHLPVRQLEGQSGKSGRERIRLLDKRLRGHAVWLTLAVFGFIIVLYSGTNGLLQLLAPEGVHASTNLFSLFGGRDESLTNQYLCSLVVVMAECLLEPYYIAAGFALYLSRRTALEGWDLEVAFKRLAARIEEKTRPSALPGVVAVCLAVAVALASLLPSHAWAQEDDDDDEDQPAVTAPAQQDKAANAAKETKDAPASPPSREKLAVRQVLAAPEFNEFADEKVWRYNGRKQNPDYTPPPFMDGLLRLFAGLSEFMRVAIWIIAIVVLGWLFAMLARHFGWFKGSFGLTRAKPDVLFGLDLRPESLPDDIPSAARALLAKGDMRAALALLYRGALSFLVHERDVEIGIGDTEGDCVRRVARLGPPALAQYFASLVENWRLIAYAGRKPEVAAVTTLINEWPRHFIRQQAPEADAPGKAVPA